MKTETIRDYDEEEDIFAINFGGKVEHSAEIDCTMILDFNKKDEVVGFEIFNFLASIKEAYEKYDKFLEGHDGTKSCIDGSELKCNSRFTENKSCAKPLKNRIKRWKW